MLQGLAMPSEGKVRFDGEDWRGEDYDRHFRMRSRIGRVFEGQAWIENLNVDENVTLSRRHHGDDAASIGADVQHWLALLQVNGLSRKRPAFVEPSVLQVHQWIRAFLGSPLMVILERPLQFLSPSWRPKLVEAIARLRARNTAVLWFTSLSADALEIPTESLQRWSLQDGRFRAFDGGSTS
jgi:phospholipid/cholesterol/gamma-HCH transport system ATP-binding protein